MNPLELVRQIRLISQNPIIANNVSISLFAHRSFGWQTEHKSAETTKAKKQKGKAKATKKKKNELLPSRVEFDIGNATMDTDLTFAFKLKNKVTFFFFVFLLFASLPLNKF